MTIRLAILAGLSLLAGCNSQPSVAMSDRAAEQALNAAEANISEDDGRGAKQTPVLGPSLGRRMNAAKSAPH